MTKIYTIGSNGKSCRSFFEILKANKIELLIDIRLNNKSQLSGFAKGGNDYLGFLLEKILGVIYIHDPFLAPTEEILDAYHKDCDWDKYVLSFGNLMKKRNMDLYFREKYGSYNNICLLCSEESPIKCHRRLVAECVAKNKEEIKHL